MKSNLKFISSSTSAIFKSLIVIFTSIVILTSFTPKALAENCQYTVNKENGIQYDISNMSDFVKNEIRPEITNPENLFNVNVIKTCDNNIVNKVVIGMQPKDYYVFYINGKKITEEPTNIVDYNNRLGLDLDKNTFTKIVDATSQYDFSVPIPKSDTRSYKQLEELYEKQRIVKMYAFVFAETARFEDAYNSLDKIFKQQCSVDWSDFDALVHNWANTSKFVIKNNLLESSQLRNGNLIAPITTKQIQKFVNSLKEGQDTKYNNSAPFLDYDYERCGQA
ncbi:MAG: hypothetical protein VKL42_12410 [Snowella sp.]|nr:hypothetical protein [Snowella sp.]